MQHYETKPEDRIPFHLKVVYGFGAFVNNLLADSIGRMVIVLNLGLGISPALIGLLGALPRITDALTDPLMGCSGSYRRDAVNRSTSGCSLPALSSSTWPTRYS